MTVGDDLPEQMADLGRQLLRVLVHQKPSRLKRLMEHLVNLDPFRILKVEQDIFADDEAEVVPDGLEREEVVVLGCNYRNPYLVGF